MDYYVLILRILHVLGGVFWTGTTWMLAGFLTPATKATGQSGQEIMRDLIGKRRLSDALAITALLSAVTGLLLYWRASGGLSPNWMTSGPGLALTVGGAAGIAGFLVGGLVTRPATKRMEAVGKQLAASDGPPNPALLEQVQQARQNLERAGVWISILLALAVLGMATSQQLLF